MAQYRLKESHPTVQKVRKLEKLADELGLTITPSFNGQLVISDSDGIEYEYRDIEQGLYSYDVTTEFPYPFETKLVFEKED